MRRFVLVVLAMLCSVPIVAQESAENSGLSSSKFGANIELTSKYMWRGMEYGTAPVVFPSISFNHRGFGIMAMGGYALNGSHQEVDLSIYYANDYISIAVSDYFYPTAVGSKDTYFNFKGSENGHWLETCMTLTHPKVPIWATVSTYFAGADKNPEGKQGWSSYAELGYSHTFNENNTVSVVAGAALNKSFYTDFNAGFNVVNIALKYSRTFTLGKCFLPLSVSYIINPYKNKSYLTFSASIGI